MLPALESAAEISVSRAIRCSDQRGCHVGSFAVCFTEAANKQSEYTEGGGQNNRNTRSCGSPPLRRRYVISCVNLAIKALNTVLLVIKSLSGAETRSCIYSDKAEFTLRPSHLTREAAGALRRDVSRVGVQLEFTESAHSKPNQIQFSSHSITTHK